MKVRPEQMEPFGSATQKAFIIRLADYVKTAHGQAAIRLGDKVSLVKSLAQNVLEGLVAAGIGRAETHGLDTEASQSGFVMLMFEIAPNFDDYPAARAILDDPTIAVDDRIQEMTQRMTSNDWGHMNRCYDHNAWKKPAGSQV